MTHQQMYRLVIEAGMETARREWWKGFTIGWLIGVLGGIIGGVIYAVWLS